MSRIMARCDEQRQAIQQLQSRCSSRSLKDLALRVVNLAIVKRPSDIHHIGLPQELQQEFRSFWGMLLTPPEINDIK
jgi:hypothetical protein